MGRTSDDHYLTSGRIKYGLGVNLSVVSQNKGRPERVEIIIPASRCETANRSLEVQYCNATPRHLKTHITTYRAAAPPACTISATKCAWMLEILLMITGYTYSKRLRHSRRLRSISREVHVRPASKLQNGFQSVALLLGVNPMVLH